MVPVQRPHFWPKPSAIVRATQNHHEICQSKVTTGFHMLWEETKAYEATLPTNHIGLNAKTIRVRNDTLPVSSSRVNREGLPERPALVVAFIHTCSQMLHT